MKWLTSLTFTGDYVQFRLVFMMLVTSPCLFIIFILVRHSTNISNINGHPRLTVFNSATKYSQPVRMTEYIPYFTINWLKLMILCWDNAWLWSYMIKNVLYADYRDNQRVIRPALLWSTFFNICSDLQSLMSWWNEFNASLRSCQKMTDQSSVNILNHISSSHTNILLIYWNISYITTQCSTNVLLFRPTVVEKLMLENMCQISRLVSIDQISEAEERDECEEGER